MYELLVRDARFAIRMLRRAPVAAAAAIITLALGVGFNTAIFSVVQAVLVDQLPYRDAGRLVAVTVESSDPRGRVPAWMVDEWGRRGRTVTQFASYDDAQLLLRDGSRTDVLRGMRVNAEFFETLGVEVAAGRGLQPEDYRPRAAVVVLTHDLWTARFGADPTVIGRVLDVDGGHYRVVGVLPADFRPLRMSNAAERPQYFAPLSFDETELAARRGGSFRVIARLAGGVAATQAQAELQAIARDLAREDGRRTTPEMPVRVQPLLDRLIGPIRPALWTLFGAVCLVLLMACANVASLQLVRATARAREFAVRASLGGSRGRLVAQLLVESLLVGAAGGAAGLALGRAGIAAIVRWAPKELARLDEVRMDGRVLLFTLVISVATALLFGLAPAWAAARADVNDVLKRSSGFSGRSFGRRLLGGLVVLDIAMAFTLVLATGVLARSYRNLLSLDAGFDARGVVTLTPVIGSRPAYASDRGRLEYYRRLIERVEAIPGVAAAGMVSNVPLSNIEPAPVRTAADASLADGNLPSADLFIVGGDYFAALRIPLVRGRLPADRAAAAGAGEVAVSASLAARRFGGRDPLGQQIQLSGLERPVQIVGVVGDVRYDRLERAPGQAVYLPQALLPFHYTRLVIRTSGEAAGFQNTIVAALRAFDPALGVFHVQPMEDYVDSALAERRFPLALIALFGSLALMLSAVGVYGVVSHSLALRTPEFGLRVALGATGRQIAILVFRQGMALVIVGLAAGAVSALAASRTLAAFVFGVAPVDPAAIVVTAAVLAGVGLLATVLPARAAGGIDPNTALKSE